MCTPGSHLAALGLFILGCASTGVVAEREAVVASKGFHVSAVIPLNEVSLGRSAVIMSMPLALVDTEIGAGRSQRLQVRRPLAFETELPTSELPWVVLGPLRDATGVLTLDARPMNATSVRRDRNEIKVDLDPGDGMRLLQVSVPASAVELQTRDPQTYFWDDMALLRWGREGHERLALHYLPKGEPTPSAFEANARVRGNPFHLRSAPEPAAASVEVLLDSRTEERQVHVLESGPVFSKVLIEGDRYTLSGWVNNSLLFKLREEGGGGGFGVGGSGSGDDHFVQQAARTEDPPPEDAWKGLAWVRLGARLYSSRGGEPIASFQFERAVTVRTTAKSGWVEIVEFPASSEPIRIIAGRLFVHRTDVQLNAAAAYGLSMQGADPWTGSHLDAFVVRAVEPNSFWSPIFEVGDQLVGIEASSQVIPFPGTATDSLQAHLESMAAHLFAGWTQGTGPSKPGLEAVVVRRDEREVRVAIPTPKLSLLMCANPPGCTEGLVEHLRGECTWERGAWRCDDRSEIRARERAR